MQADHRRLEVLRAIVEDFVRTKEPVGSKLIAERHHLGVSPATIRNDMAALEEEGLIAQPHTSAGRIPTDLGYRVFVDRLSSVKQLTTGERNAIKSFLGSAVDVNDVVHRAGRLLAQLTGQVAVVQYPALGGSVVQHIELVQLTPHKLLLVIITDTGRVVQRNVELVGAFADEAVARVRTALNQLASKRHPHEIVAELAKLDLSETDEEQGLLADLARMVRQILAEEGDDRIVLAGTANLARLGVSFGDLRPVLEALEEQVVLLNLISQMTEDNPGISVRIGRETQSVNLLETSVVTTGYGSAIGTLGAVGSLGPTGMDYAATIAAVHAVARYLSQTLTT